MKIYKLIGTTMFILLLTGIGANIALADLDKLKAEEKTKTDINISAGYRGVSEDNNPSRALEYDSLKSSPLFNVDLATDQGSYFLNFNFDYLNENDYSGELNLNSKGLAQVNLRSERFFHNLDHIPYDNGYTGGEPTTAVPDPGPPLVRVQLERPQKEVALTARLPTRSAMMSRAPSTRTRTQAMITAYDWTPTNSKSGSSIRPTPRTLTWPTGAMKRRATNSCALSDENCATACHMQSKTRKMDRVTEEFKAEVDAHVGIVDLGHGNFIPEPSMTASLFPATTLVRIVGGETFPGTSSAQRGSRQPNHGTHPQGEHSSQWWARRKREFHNWQTRKRI